MDSGDIPMSKQEIEAIRARIRERKLKGMMAVGFLLESLAVDPARIDSAMEILFPEETRELDELEKKKAIRASLVLP